MDWSFLGQWTTTVTSCIPHNSVYMPGPRAGKSKNGVLSKWKGHRIKYQNKDFVKNGRKNFRGYTMMRKRRKPFALFARKQREKSPFASGECINFQHSTLTKHAAKLVCDTWLQILQNDFKICEAEVTLTPLMKKNLQTLLPTSPCRARNCTFQADQCD